VAPSFRNEAAILFDFAGSRTIGERPLFADIVEKVA
jgi:hypothetical protein